MTVLLAPSPSPKCQWHLEPTGCPAFPARRPVSFMSKTELRHSRRTSRNRKTARADPSVSRNNEREFRTLSDCPLKSLVNLASFCQNQVDISCQDNIPIFLAESPRIGRPSARWDTIASLRLPNFVGSFGFVPVRRVELSNGKFPSRQRTSLVAVQSQ